MDEATWELQDAMHEAYLFLFSFENTKDDVILRGRGMYYPDFDPLNAVINFVNNVIGNVVPNIDFKVQGPTSEFLGL